MRRIQPIKVDRPNRPRGREPLRLLNLGPKSSAWLAAIGIRTREQIRELGPVETCRRLRLAGHPASVLLAYALESALTDTPWQDIPAETKAWLRADFTRMKRETPRRD